MRLFYMFLLLFTFISTAEARNTKHLLSIEDALNDPRFLEVIGSEVSFFFGKQNSPKVVKEFGTFTSNKKTNSFGKSDEVACQWAMLSALKQFRKKALKLGGNAVINIKSYYKKRPFSSETEYECHAGNIVSGVALRGTVVKIGK